MKGPEGGKVLLEGNPERSAVFSWSVCPNEDSLLLVQEGLRKREPCNYLAPLGKCMSSLFFKYLAVIAGNKRKKLQSTGLDFNLQHEDIVLSLLIRYVMANLVGQVT